MEKTVYKQFLAILCLLLLFAGCSRSAKLDGQANGPITQAPYDMKQTASSPFASASPVEEDPTPVPTKMTSLYANDYAFLWQTLETDYPYLPYLKQKGVNIDGIREHYAKQVNQAKDDQQFLTILQNLFKDLGNTAHLSALDPFSFQSDYSLFVLDPDVSSKPELALFRKVLQDRAPE